MKSKKIVIDYKEYDTIHELEKNELMLLQQAEKACQHAYAPYSSFRVGAAVLLDNGKTVIGSNQENAAYPSGLCAERVAMFSASSKYPGVPFRMIAIVAQTDNFTIDFPVSPCGACRQVMAEYEYVSKKPIKVILKGQKGKIVVIESIEKMMPLVFNAKQILSSKKNKN